MNANSKDQKQASKKHYQGTRCLSPQEMDWYQKKNQYFWFGKIGHTYCEFPQCNTKCKTPKVSNVMATSFDDLQEVYQFCHVWGKIQDQHALILINPS